MQVLLLEKKPIYACFFSIGNYITRLVCRAQTVLKTIKTKDSAWLKLRNILIHRQTYSYSKGTQCEGGQTTQ